MFARVRPLSPSSLLDWWLEIQTQGSGRAQESQTGAAVAAQLTGLSEAPPGALVRDRFATLLRVSHPPEFADMLWDGVRNIRETAHARAALLALLYDLGEEEALHHLLRHSGTSRKYLAAFIALVTRARSEPSPKLHAAIHHNLLVLQQLKGPFRVFLDRLAKRFDYVSPRTHLEVSPALERHDSRSYSVVVSIDPDESDPPLSLSLELLDSSDFECVRGDSPLKVVVNDVLLFERYETEYVVRPRGAGAATIAFRLYGETASGHRLDSTHRYPVTLAEGEQFERIAVEDLLDVYEGYDGRPVTGYPAFVGREEELANLERTLARGNPGAVVLYGARRLGKTSLLNELTRRYCVTARAWSTTLFLVCPVDEFSVGDTRPFLDRFLKHIWAALLHDPKNEAFRKLLMDQGTSRQALELAGRLGEDFENSSFLMRLREYFRRVRELAGGRVRQVVLVLDEFDKLLEHYRKGYEANVEELMNQLRRAATEESDIGLILAGSDLMRNVVDRYRNALYGSTTVIELKCLDNAKDRTAAAKIIAPQALRDRRRFSPQVVSDIVTITGGHPLYMRLVACGSASLSRRRSVSRGTVIETVHKLLRNEVLPGYLPDPPNLVIQPLQVLRLLDPVDQTLAEIVLRQLARHTGLERPWATWATVVHDDRLLALKPSETWLRIRDELHRAQLIVPNESRQWGFRYPILGERLRVDLDLQLDKLCAEAAGAVSSAT